MDSGREKTIWFRGRKYRVLKELTVGKKKYFVTRKLSGLRERYQAFDRHAGPDGDMRAIHVYPRSRHVLRKMNLLKRVSENNSNVPTILEYHPHKDHVHVVLTWIWGEDVKTFLTKVRNGEYPRPSWPEAFRMIRGLAHGISNLHHKKNIVHGDLKPANLILTREATRLVTIDFGSAWFVEETMRKSDGDGISDCYGAPEQHASEDGAVNAAPSFLSDQFSLSVVFYELLTLQIPFEGLGGKAGADEDHRRAYGHTLVRPSRLGGQRGRLPWGVKRKINRVVMRGLSILPQDRYAGREEWLRDLDDINSRLKQTTYLGRVETAMSDLAARTTELWDRLK